jgi:hypothetical protein
MKKLLVIPLALASLLFAGCTATAGSMEPLLEVGLSGGRCAEGVCETSYTVYEDGSTNASSKITVNVELLKTAIADSSLDDLAGDPEASCPSYVDASDLTIRVYAWGDEIFKPCELEDAEQDVLTIEAQKLITEINHAERNFENE